MTADQNALRFLLLTFAGWVNRHQQDVIAYLVEENRSTEGAPRGEPPIPIHAPTPEVPSKGENP